MPPRTLCRTPDTTTPPTHNRVIRHDGFFEWWTRDNQPKGSGQYRGSAGVLGMAILELQRWAQNHVPPEPRPAVAPRVYSPTPLPGETPK